MADDPIRPVKVARPDVGSTIEHQRSIRVENAARNATARIVVHPHIRDSVRERLV